MEKDIKFGKILKDYRIARNISAKKLADDLKVKPTTVSMWERGKSYPGVPKLAELCGLMSVSVDEMLFGYGNSILDGLTDMQKFLITQSIKEFKRQ